ncbi:hypothetical protein VTK73DRAFT_7460 [Phialemonium thermophilum]|uniref:Amidohydrolase-related domain-containing protein n=1 Tax=Phialemonium thermophilum TaxID=223376 RepID=A0ABR3WEF9_9PEZI
MSQPADRLVMTPLRTDSRVPSRCTSNLYYLYSRCGIIHYERAYLRLVAMLAIRARRVLTSSSAELLDDGVVVVDGEKIANVGTWAELGDSLVGSDVAVRDLGDVTLMPGLFDCHVGCHMRSEP